MTQYSKWAHLPIFRSTKLRKIIRVNYLHQGEPSGRSKSNGDSRIEMGTRNVTNSVNQHCYNQPPSNCYPRKCYHVVVVLIHHPWSTPCKYQEICSHPGATLPYSEFNGFNKSPTTVRLGPDLELSSTVCVAINTIFYSLRSVYFVYHSAVNIRILSYRSIVVLKLYNSNNGNSNPNCHLYQLVS